MEVTQTYARPSTAQTDATGMKFDFSAELSRKPVSIQALIKNSLSYARLMLALRQVVKSDWRPVQKDHTAYQDWVMERYLEELPEHLKDVDPEKAKLLLKREKLKTEQRKLQGQVAPLQAEMNKARRNYYDWLYKHDREQWIVLDPVVSVHPDGVIFEAFSLDESSYGRVTVPVSNLEVFGKVDYGTTNIDFSQVLANELYRVRSYRPAWLKVSFEKVELSTFVGAAVEKKIDLPVSWVKGFLQVQAASTFEGIDLTLHSQTVANMLFHLEAKKEKVSPRSLRFVLKKGEPIQIVIDPWQITLTDPHIYQGETVEEIRIWGRRRLLVLKELLPYSDEVHLKLMGTGMPSYWTVQSEGHRFDLGLSGWSANDWSKKAGFDLLASTTEVSKKVLEKTEKLLIKQLSLVPSEASKTLDISREEATAALQTLCKLGQAMYDHLTQSYRWRQLLQQDLKLPETEEDERLKYAMQLFKSKKVKQKNQIQEQDNLVRYEFEVEGKSLYKPVLHLDQDGRVKQATCTCSFARRNKLRLGPCPHMMAAIVSLLKR